MPTEIQTPLQWKRLADEFRLTGRHKLLLDEVVVPVAVIAELSPGEAPDPNDATAFFQVSAVVALNGFATLTNLTTEPPLIVDKVTFTCPQPAQVLIFFNTIAAITLAAGSIINKVWNDPTQPGEPLGVAVAATDAFEAGAGQLYQMNSLANTAIVIEPKFQVRGGVFSVGTDVANQAFQVTMQYRVGATI